MEKSKRNIHYSFKVSPDEDAAIRQKMKSFGIRNRSTYLRAMMLNGYLLKLDLQEMHKAVRLMGTMSNNVNQIARRMNEHGSIYETEMDEIVDAQRELKALLSQILQQPGHDHDYNQRKNIATQRRIVQSHPPHSFERGNVMATTHINCDELFVINQRFPKNIHTCTKDIAEHFDLKQAIKIPNLLSSQYAM